MRCITAAGGFFDLKRLLQANNVPSGPQSPPPPPRMPVCFIIPGDPQGITPCTLCTYLLPIAPLPCSVLLQVSILVPSRGPNRGFLEIFGVFVALGGVVRRGVLGGAVPFRFRPHEGRDGCARLGEPAISRQRGLPKAGLLHSGKRLFFYSL